MNSGVFFIFLPFGMSSFLNIFNLFCPHWWTHVHMHMCTYIHTHTNPDTRTHTHMPAQTHTPAQTQAMGHGSRSEDTFRGLVLSLGCVGQRMNSGHWACGRCLYQLSHFTSLFETSDNQNSGSYVLKTCFIFIIFPWLKDQRIGEQSEVGTTGFLVLA